MAKVPSSSEMDNHPAILAVKELNALPRGTKGEVIVSEPLMGTLVRETLNSFAFGGGLGFLKCLKFEIDLQPGISVSVEVPASLSPSQIDFVRSSLDFIFTTAAANYAEQKARADYAATATVAE